MYEIDFEDISFKIIGSKKSSAVIHVLTTAEEVKVYE